MNILNNAVFSITLITSLNIFSAAAERTLHDAASTNNIELAKQLIASEANVNRQINGLTPLFVATHMGHAELTKVLLDAGADPEITNARGKTPFYWALSETRCQCMQHLLRAGADACKDVSRNQAMTRINPLTATLLSNFLPRSNSEQTETETIFLL